MTAAAIVEQAVVVGDEVPLIGTLTGRPSADRPAVVLLNAGLIQRAGPDGLHVRLAAAFADRGYATLRLDYSGVGDSPVRRDRVPIHEARVLETRSALDWLEREHGSGSFVLAGICTGADNAFRAALADERISGLVLMDGYPHRTAAWWVRHYGQRLFRISSWRTLLGRRSGAPRDGAEGDGGAAGFAGRAAAGGSAAPDAQPGWDGIARLLPSRVEMAAHLRTLIDRGTELYFICTGGFSDWVNHAGQLKGAFRRVPFRGRVLIEYWPAADHVFRAAASQADLVDRVGGWLDTKWPGG